MTWFDALVLVVLILSVGFAVIRGAIREFATLAALGGGALLAYLSFTPVLGALNLQGSFFGMVAIGVALMGVFFVILYIAAFFALRLLDLSPEMTRIDRIGGGVFGLLRGLALVGLSFLGYAYYLDVDRRPEAVSNALLLPVAEVSAGFFERLAPKHEPESVITPEELEEKLNAADEGYARDDRNALNEIVTTTTTSPSPIDEPSQTQGADGDPIADLLSPDADDGAN